MARASNGVRYCTGYCRLRPAIRHFRLNRILELRLVAERFEHREAFSPPAVRVRLAPQIVPPVHERQHYGFETADESGEGQGTVMVYTVKRLDSRLGSGLGALAEPLEPVELRTLIKNEARKLIKLLT